MNAETLNTAIAEAERFLRLAREAKKAMENAKKPGSDVTPNRQRAAATRASMDLTHALADMRKSLS